MAVKRRRDDQPTPEVWSEWQRQQVLKARDPVWLRARAEGCRAILDGNWRKHSPEHTTVDLRLAGLGYGHLRPPGWLAAEAEKCEQRADAIERGDEVPDWYVTRRGQIERP